MESRRSLTPWIHLISHGLYVVERLLEVRLGSRRQVAEGLLDPDKMADAGLWSSTHVLALMYGGELGYWGHTECAGAAGDLNYGSPPPVALYLVSA